MSTEFDLLKGFIKKPEDLKYPQLVLLYGPPGCGKTHFGLTLTEVEGLVENMVVLDTEGSTVGVASRFDSDRLSILRVDEQEDPLATFNTLINRFDLAAKKARKEGKHPKELLGFDALQVDTLDTIQEYARGAFEKSPKIKTQGGEDDTRKMWGMLNRWTMNVGRVLKSLDIPVNVVMHDREEVLESTKERFTKINLLSGARNTFPGIPDTVVYMTRTLEKIDGKDQRVFYSRFVTNDKIVTKERFDLPPILSNTNFPQIYKYIDNQLKKEKK